MIAVGCWLALGLPRAARVASQGEGAVRWLGFGFLALGAAIAWFGIRRFDEGVGCLSGIGIGAGFWAASRWAPRSAVDPVRDGLIELAGGAVAPILILGATLASKVARDRSPVCRKGAPEEPETEPRIAPYQIGERIMTDGLVSVYRASDDAGVAFNLQKVAAPHLLEDFDDRQFAKDAKRLMSVRHAHLVTVLDFGVEAGLPWMAFVPWPPETLTGLLRRGRMEPSRAVALVAEVASALEAVHVSGLVHGALSPWLVHVAGDGAVLVSGLDLGWILSEWKRRASQPAQIGNAAYHSPEELTGKHSISVRTDVYRLGLLAFECLTGSRPFEYDGALPHAMRKLEMRITDPRDAGVDPGTFDVLRRSLDPDPDARWPSAAAFSAALIAAAGG